MTPFTTVVGVAAALPIPNVNTDIIAPKALLRMVTRDGMGGSLFGPLRYDRQGRENPDFVLNREPFRTSKIVAALENFGCGSSREHAAWALLDFGIRVVIAPSFAEIFTNNSFKAGLLPIVLDPDMVVRGMSAAETGLDLTVDLEAQTIRLPSGQEIAFEVDPVRRTALLAGRDDIAATLEHDAGISAYEATMWGDAPWLRTSPGRI